MRLYLFIVYTKMKLTEVDIELYISMPLIHILNQFILLFKINLIGK